MRVSKEQLEKWYLEDKLNQTEIGEIVGVDRKAIDYYLKKYDIPKRSRKEASSLSVERRTGKRMTVEEIINRINKGDLIADLVEETGHSRNVFGKILRDNGINLRNHEGHRKRQSEFMKKSNPVPKGSKRSLETISKRSATVSRLALERYKTLDSFEKYAKAARYWAYKHFDMGELIPDGLVIDHMLSIRDGWRLNVAVEDISHPANLRLISREENLRKAYHSILTLEELTKRIGVQRLSRERVEASASKSRAPETAKI